MAMAMATSPTTAAATDAAIAAVLRFWANGAAEDDVGVGVVDVVVSTGNDVCQSCVPLGSALSSVYLGKIIVMVMAEPAAENLGYAHQGIECNESRVFIRRNLKGVISRFQALD